MKELLQIQQSLKAPKKQYNKFGGFHYRSCEDILEAVKPILAKHQCTLTLCDDIALIGDRFYVKATATLTNSTGEMCNSVAFARESEPKKGCDAAQGTGSVSSYARKYALNGLFCIDDAKDADSNDNQDKEINETQPQVVSQIARADEQLKTAIGEIREVASVGELTNIFNKWKSINKAFCDPGADFYNEAAKKKQTLL